MNRWIVLVRLSLLALALAVTGAGCLRSGPSTRAETGSVEGWVYRSGGDSPSYSVTDSPAPPDGFLAVAGASATIDGEGVAARSDSTGRFLLAGVAVGARVLTVSVPNAWATKLPVTVTHDAVARVPGMQKPWGIYLYGVAPQELVASLKAIVNGLQTVGSNENFYIVAQLAQYDSASGTQKTQRFVIGRGNSVEVRDMGDVDMGDKANLRDFVDWADLNYPTDHHMLLTFSHGDGWRASSTTRGTAADLTRSIMIDAQHGNSVDADQLAQALSGKRFDVVVLNECSTGGIEWAYELKEAADYVVVSEGLSFSYDYESLITRLNLNPQDPLAAVRAMIDSLMITLNALHYPATASVIRTAGLPPLASALSSLAESILAEGETETVVNTLARDPDVVQVFSETGIVRDGYGHVNYNAVDIYDLARVIAASSLSLPTRAAAQAVVDRLEATVAYNVALPWTTSVLLGNTGYSVARAKGLMVAWPYDSTSDNSFDPSSPSDGLYSVLSFARETEWDTLLQHRGAVIH